MDCVTSRSARRRQSPLRARCSSARKTKGPGANRCASRSLGRRSTIFSPMAALALFGCVAQVPTDSFFLGGAQIDGEGNINLVGSGDYPHNDVRWPGSFGSSFMYFVVPRVILFREEHSPRVFVERVDFISAPGTSAANVDRRGGPHALLTGMALFSFDKARSRFRLESVHPGFTAADVRAATGFDYHAPGHVPETAAPDAATLALLRGRVRQELAESYPSFAATLPEWREAA